MGTNYRCGTPLTDRQLFDKYQNSIMKILLRTNMPWQKKVLTIAELTGGMKYALDRLEGAKSAPPLKQKTRLPPIGGVKKNPTRRTLFRK